MQEIWVRIETWLRTNAPQILETLRSPASDAQIKAVENRLSIQFPEDVKNSYCIHNGQSSYEYGLIEGREFLSLERIQDEWQVWKGLLDDGDFDGIESDPDAGIRRDWWSPQWIPLTYNGAGYHDCLDLNPAEGGIGQIISMYHDSGDREIVAPSFREWLDKYAEGLESGQYVFSDYYNGIVSIDDV